MDFLKTLLVYMGLTFATTVQGAPTPEITPEPTPTAIVTQQPDAGETAQLTPSPTPYTAVAGATATPVMITSAPAPTMTPNAAYKTLNSGDRGDNVKTLQQRLKDLGYLTGEVDGAYGNQTRRAVQRFQYYNGLDQDGVAGKKTQTVLFESADVIASPDLVTPTPASSDASVSTLAPAAATAAENTNGVIPLADAAGDASAVSTEPYSLVADASVVLNGAGEKLHALVMEDGVQVDRAPKVYMGASGQVLLPLGETANCVENWTFTHSSEHEWTLACAGYTLRFYATLDAQGAPEAWTVQVDDDALDVVDGEIYVGEKDELLVATTILTRALGAECTWDSEENTLMIQYVDKEVAQSND